MQKKFLKSLRLLTAFAVILSMSMLTACDPDENVNVGKAESPMTLPNETNEETLPPAKERVEIRFYYGLGSEAGITMENIIRDFNDSQEDYTVLGIQQGSYDDTINKIKADKAAGKELPDVYISEFMVNQVDEGIIAPITNLIDERTPIEDYLEVFIDPAKIEGEIFALPAFGTTQVIYYRKDLLDKAGINPKEMYSSWENIYKYSKELQNKGICDYGHLPMWGPNNLIDIARSNGGEILSADSTKVKFNEKPWVDSWDFIRKQIFDDQTCVIESGGEGWAYWYRTIDNVMNGKAVSYTGSSGDKGDLDFSKIDSITQPGLNGNQARPVAHGIYLAIPQGTPPEKMKGAYAWMAYFTSPEVSADWSRAIGYIPVRKSSVDVASYKEYIAANPYAGVPYEQAQFAAPPFIDPTGGEILAILNEAADRLQLENVPAQEVLDDAAKAAQAALDAVK